MVAFATPGEFEPVTFALYPVRSLQNLKVRVSSLTSTTGQLPASRIDVRLATYWNVGYPPDWIRTIGKQLFKVHIKRFEPDIDRPKSEPTGRRTEGINWPDVRQSLAEVGYSGWIRAEIRGGDANYLREVSARMDRILNGQNPAA